MIRKGLDATIKVLERQYYRYFYLNMGMFSAAQRRAPSVTMCSLSSQMRARKNKTLDYLDSMETDQREKFIKISIRLARKRRGQKRIVHAELK